MITKQILLILPIIIMNLACFQNQGKKVPNLRVFAQALEGEFLRQNDRTIINSPNTLELANYFVWGGSVIKADDQKYHLLFSLWECGAEWAPFEDGWLLNSKIAYAVSDHPNKEFKFQKIVLQGRRLEGDSTTWDARSVHNPHLKKFDGKYYLYYTGSRDPGTQPKGSAGENLNQRNRIQQSQQLGVIEFDSFDDLVNGNFYRPDKPLLSPRTRVKVNNVLNPSPPGTDPRPDNLIVVNPSVVQRPSDGKYLLYFKGNLWDPHWRGVHGVAISDSPTGPFTARDDFVFDFRTEDGKIASAEDPYVWFHKNHNRFYVIFKDFTGKITGAEPGLAILFSLDGIDWQKPAKSLFMKKELLFPKGQILKVNNLERPQLLIDNDGFPKVLYAACAINSPHGNKNGATFNVQIPLKTEP